MIKINRWFLGFFLAVLWPSALMLCAEEPSRAAASSQNVVPSASDATAPGIDSTAQTEEEIRDPFARIDVAPTAAVPVAAAPEISVDLQGIGFGSKGAYAIIGGDVFYKGDEKNGIKLIEVRKREVDASSGGRMVTVPLYDNGDLNKARDRAKKKSAMEKPSVDQPSETPSSLSEREQPPS